MLYRRRRTITAPKSAISATPSPAPRGCLLREPLSSADLRRAREILSTYADQGFGLTDAAVMAVAERLDVSVLTLDRRHFGVFRNASGRELPLLP